MMAEMLEALWAGLVLVAIGAVTATVLVPWHELLEAGQAVMLGSGAVGIPLEILYYASLGVILHTTKRAPKGWYWQSFAHHHLLVRWQRRLVMPLFYAGALAFVGVAFGIGLVVLAFVAAGRQS